MKSKLLPSLSFFLHGLASERAPLIGPRGLSSAAINGVVGRCDL